MDFKAAKCPSCAGELQLPDNLDSAKCMYCGNTIVVREAIKLAAGSVNLDNLLRLANTALESGNNTEAYSYYTKVLEYDQDNYMAWYGKGVSAAWQSTIGKLRIIEGLSCISTAFNKEPNGEAVSTLKLKAALDLGNIAVSLDKAIKEYFHKSAVDHYVAKMTEQWGQINNEKKELFAQQIKLYEFIHNCSPSATMLDNILSIYVEYFFYYSTDEVKYIVKKRQLIDPSFSFALFAKKMPYVIGDGKGGNELGGGGRNIYNEDGFINFINSVDNKNKLSIIQTQPAPANSGGCFIATAAWGTPLADQVISLQLFRDTHLIKNEYGRLFVSLYYRVSPPIADIIRRDALLRTMVRAVLKPIVFAVKFMK
ncbi:MAG: CFI-box-CTERM domain-containing protein [Desulfuromonadales bacterium]